MHTIKRIHYILLAVPILLAIPLTGTMVSESVQWDSFDFLVMGILLLGAGLLLEWILRRVSRTSSRGVWILLLALAFLLLWAELAVGIFGSPLAGS